MTKQSGRTAVMIGVGLALVPLLLFAYFGLQTRLIADDYANVGLPLKIGVWETMLHWRGIWNGGYSSFLMWGLLAPLGAAAAASFSLITISSLFAAYSWLANTALALLGRRGYRRTIAVCLASLMAAATINGFYSPHTFYWYASGVTYTFPVVMFLIGIALAGETARRLGGGLKQVLAGLATALYAFINGGFSELYLVFQLTCVAMMAGYYYFFYAGSKRRTYLILALAASLGTFASLWLQVSAPGFAIRSAVKVQGDVLALPLQDMFGLIVRALETTLVYTGSDTSFAGFMLVAFAALFLTLSAGHGGLEDSKSLRIPGISAPIAFVLIVQLLFIPILWTHQSDDPQILGRFSYGFGLVVGLNLCAGAILLALLWRRQTFTDRLNRPDGLMKFCGCVLLIVCLLFALTQARSIHYRASSYLFLTALSLLLMLGGLLASLEDEPRIRRLFWLGASVAAGALLTLAVLVSVEMVLARFVNRRSIAAVIFALTLAGMMNGVGLGALIGRGFYLTQASAVWLRRVRFLCLIAAFTIAAGIVIGQARRIIHVQQFVALWESQHQEIIRLRDEGDAAVFTELYARINPGKMDHRPPEYEYHRLRWPEKIFYGLDYEDAYS